MNNDEVLELVKKFNSKLNAYDNEPTFYTSSMDTLESFAQIVISEQVETIANLKEDNAKLRELVKNLRPQYGDVGTRDSNIAETQRLFDEALGETK